MQPLELVFPCRFLRSTSGALRANRAERPLRGSLVPTYRGPSTTAQERLRPLAPAVAVRLISSPRRANLAALRLLSPILASRATFSSEARRPFSEARVARCE